METCIPGESFDVLINSLRADYFNKFLSLNSSGIRQFFTSRKSMSTFESEKWFSMELYFLWQATIVLSRRVAMDSQSNPKSINSIINFSSISENLPFFHNRILLYSIFVSNDCFHQKCLFLFLLNISLLVFFWIYLEWCTVSIQFPKLQIAHRIHWNQLLFTEYYYT